MKKTTTKQKPRFMPVEIKQADRIKALEADVESLKLHIYRQRAVISYLEELIGIKGLL